MDVDGQEHSIHRHDAWKACTLHLRAVDLKHAVERDKPVYWQNLALPFGATGSVYDFNSVARALELISSDWVGVVTSSFFDD
eukprot:2680206-Amphidinium_carterae.1